MSAAPFVTIFANNKGERINAARGMDFTEIERVIRTAPAAPGKDALPLLKLATFGGVRTQKNCLRHDDNVLEVHGIEGDYDGEQMPMRDAAEALSAAGVAALLYTSARHTPERPRWRVIVALSAPLQGTPDELREQRRHWTGTLNALLGGVLKSESFALSQSYYFGPIQGQPEPEIIRLSGVCLDQMESPPAPVFPAAKTKADRRVSSGNGAGGVGEDRSRDLLARVGQLVREGKADHEIHALQAQHPHVLDQADGARAIQRAIGVARSEVQPVAPAREARGPASVVAAPETFTDTDIANAKRLAEHHGADLHFTPERGWLVWDGRRWATDEKAVQVQARAKATALAIFDEVKDSIDRDALFKHAKRSQQKGAIEAMIWLARSEPGIPAHLVGFDTDGYLFNVGNGTVDLRTGQLRPHRREDLISNIVDVPFKRDATCSLWDAFLWRVTDKSEELCAYLQRFVGYLLTGDTTEQALHFLYGLGANGKTVFCDVLMRILGDYAVAVSPDLIMVRRHSGIPNDVARLRGARAALMNETTQGARFDEAKLKDLTGGDVLTARFLHAEFFDFRPTHRIVIRGNHKPTINGIDEGIWRRLRLVPFTVSIPKDEQDRKLLEKLATELPGILQWAIRGCLAWQQHGLDPPAVITDAVRAYREESDTLGRFIEEHCHVRKLAQVKTGVFFQHYQTYAEQVGERWMPSKDLPHEMQRRGFQWKRTNQGGMYFGLEFTATDAPPWSESR